VTAVLAGDGIGPEVVGAAVSVLKACLPVTVREGLVGGAAIDATGDPLPRETLDICLQANAVLLGPLGAPEALLQRLRRALSLHATLRPARYLGLPTPLRDGLARHADLLVVRDVPGAPEAGEPWGATSTEAVNIWRLSADQVRRVAHVAFQQARRRRRKLTSVDKAGLLETSRLWRAVVSEVAREYPDLELEHRPLEGVGFEILCAPHHFDVIVTENLFGEILADQAAAVAGSIGLLASACLGSGPPGLYQPVHGPAGDLAGRGVANPTGAILAVALLIEHALGQPELARAIEASVAAALREVRTPDIGGSAGTEELTAAVLRHLSWSRWSQSQEEDEGSVAEWGV